MGISRTGIINDLHVPFHDPKLVKLVLEAFEDIGITRLIINGDFLDMYHVSRYDKKSLPFTTFEDEIYEGREMLADIRRRFPKIPIIFLYGNHEARLEAFIEKNAKAFHNFFNLEIMLELERLDIEFYHYNYCYQLEKTNLYIQHSPPSYGVNGARTSLLKKMDASFIYGCTHRKQVSCVTGHSGEVYTVYFNGWLGSTTLTPEHQEVFSYAKGHENWQHAAAVVNVIDEKEFFVDQLEIKNYKLLLDGNIYYED